MSDEIKTAVGVISIPLWPRQNETVVRRQENTMSKALSEDEKRICAAFGMSPSSLRNQLALLASRKTDERSLTAEELAVCRLTNMKPREFLARKAALKGGTAIAAGDGLGIPTGGLLRAHQMVDAPHKTVYEDSADHGDAWKTATNNASDSIVLMHQNLSSLFDAMASPTLPWFTSMTGKLTGAIQHATSASEKHSAITSGAIIGMSAVGTTVYGAVSGLQALGTTTMFAGQGAKFLGKAWSFAPDFQGNTLRVMYATEKLGKFASGVGEATLRLGKLGGSLLNAIPGLTSLGGGLLKAIPSLWGFAAALWANPITWFVGGIALIAVAAYEIYEHWGAIAGFFKNAWGEIKTVFTEAWGWMKTAGLHLMESLGEGILAGIEFPFKAAWHVAEKIGRIVVGHSPPPERPLHELGRISIADTLAERIKPGPVLSAIHRTAAAVAIAAPMMLGPGGAAMASTGASGGAVVINYAPHVEVHAAAGADTAGFRKLVIEALKHDCYELVRLIESEQTRRERSRSS